MSQIYNDNIERPKLQHLPLRILKNLCILLENLAEGLRSRREHCWSVVVSAFEHTTKILVVQGRVQLGHSSHIVKVSVEVTWWHFNPWYILKGMTEPVVPLGTMPQEP